MKKILFLIILLSQFILANNALSLETTCDSCSDCSSKLNGSYDKVTLTKDLSINTGSCIIINSGDVIFDCVDVAQLTMRDFSDRFLDDYLDMLGDDAMASVGAYQLEGIGIHLFERVKGDHFTILGLPLLPLLAFLRQNGFIAG